MEKQRESLGIHIKSFNGEKQEFGDICCLRSLMSHLTELQSGLILPDRTVLWPTLLPPRKTTIRAQPPTRSSTCQTSDVFISTTQTSKAKVRVGRYEIELRWLLIGRLACFSSTLDRLTEDKTKKKDAARQELHEDSGRDYLTVHNRC